MRGSVAVLLLGTALLAGCTDAKPEPIRPVAPTSTSPPASPTPAPPTAASESAAPSDQPSPRADPDVVRRATAMAAVRYLALEVGPRPGTSRAYRRAAHWVRGRLTELGWRVETQPFPTPAGTSWGVPVPAGTSLNVLATRGDVRPGRPWMLVGAHLDTVPQAPGAEDNASGIGVLLSVAEAVADRRTRLPVVLVAFGSEEPRGESDDDHHYGSRAYVESLTDQQRRTLRGMVSLDRVGVGAAVPVGSVAPGDPLQAELRRAASRAGVPVVTESGQKSSDHWSFVRAGLPGVRLGSTSYAEYHSAQDLPPVVDPAQLERTARIVVSWLAG